MSTFNTAHNLFFSLQEDLFLANVPHPSAPNRRLQYVPRRVFVSLSTWTEVSRARHSCGAARKGARPCFVRTGSPLAPRTGRCCTVATLTSATEMLFQPHRTETLKNLLQVSVIWNIFCPNGNYLELKCLWNNLLLTWTLLLLCFWQFLWLELNGLWLILHF